ncbi:MAG: HAD-IG family 5'-nucleotidase [Polyangia bacterium]|jgi:HAD superfamily 5'-nucleotidase-like hydrolase|nr:HAD-IG family 5'-nucleotidase [Polyangia bacterium]
MGIEAILSKLPKPPPAGRGIFCNRTLNLRSIRAIGYDMDYTLVHYNVLEWERRAYEHLRLKTAALGWPVGDLVFDPELGIRGLVIDTELGNLLKANRFGYVKRAFHGQRPLEFEEQREIYAREVVDLGEARWVFLNTLFSLSESCMYAQLVELHDARRLPGVLSYPDLYRRVKAHMDEAHMEGALKAEILANPERFIELDPELPVALEDQRDAGKKLLLITNSDWPYTAAIMSYALDRYLGGGRTWRDLFDLVIVSARKPEFFSSRDPIFEVVDDSGLLRPLAGGIRGPGAYVGGNAQQVEDFLGASGADILFVGDHAYGDVHQSKHLRRWRTALVVRELEQELEALEAFAPQQDELQASMAEKDRLEFQLAQVRVALRRLESGRKALHEEASPEPPGKRDLDRAQDSLRARLAALDERISPLAKASSELQSSRWGLLMRTGADKSLMARHVERHADIYTSRVSNFLHVTPFAYLPSPRGSLPHDPLPGLGAPKKDTAP